MHAPGLLRDDIIEIFRGLRASRWLLVTAIVTLGAAIGMNLAMVGLVGRALLTPARHITDPEALVAVAFERETSDGGLIRTTTTSWPSFLQLRDGVESFAASAAFQQGPSGLAIDDEQRPARTVLVSPEYFGVLGARPLMGAAFERRDEGGAAVISHAFWSSAFGSDPGVLGRRVVLNGRPFHVAAVMPRGFSGHAPEAIDAWFPIEQAMSGTPDWDNPFRNIVSVIARVRPGREAAAGAQASAVLGRRVVLSSLEGSAATPEERRIAWWLTAVSALVLLIGLANAGTLLLVRAARRRRESSIRGALGASRLRLSGHIAGEAALIALGAAAASIFLGIWLDEVVRRVLLPGVIPAEGVDARTTAAAVMAGLVTAVVAFAAGVAHLPARQGSLSPRTGSASALTRSQRALLIVQTAVSVLLLAGAGMFGRSLHALMTQDFGMNVHDVLAVDFEQGPGSIAGQDEIFTAAVEQIRALPGVVSASVYQATPFGSFHVPPIAVPGRAEPPSVGGQLPFLIAATPELFDVLGIEVVEGRGFTPADERGAPVVVINRTMARAVWPGESAVGKCIRIGFDPDFDPSTATGPPVPSPAVPCREIIGVARDVRQRSIVPSGDEARLMQYYVPIAQVPLPPALVGSGPNINGVLVRVAGDSPALVTAIRRIVAGSGQDLPFTRVTPFAERFQRQVRPWTLGTTLLIVFGVVAVGIAAVGLYAAFAHAVTSRRHELAVRLALGATASRVRWLVLRDACAITAFGASAGGAIAFLAGRSLEAVLFGIVPADPIALGGAAACMLLIAFSATIVPAVTAARSDPGRLLRAE